MNDKKVELIKKKQLLEDYKRRKLKRDQEKVTLNLLNSILSFFFCFNFKFHFQNDRLKEQVMGVNNNNNNEFNNLNNVDEILAKCGLNSLVNSKSFNTLTPSSSTMSVSSSSQSIQSNSTVINVNTTSNNKKNSSNDDSKKELFTFIVDTDDDLTIEDKLKKLTAHYNQNVINIYPNESLIKYTKQTQTQISRKEPNVTSTASSETASITDSIDVDSVCSNDTINSTSFGYSPNKIINTDSDTPTRIKNNSKRLKKRNNSTKPLNYYEDTFVFDTLQWEDEFQSNEEDDEVEDIEQKMKEIHNIINDSSLSMGHLNLNNDQHLNNTNNLPLNLNDKNDDNLLEFLQNIKPVIERALIQNDKNIHIDYTISKINKFLNFDGTTTTTSATSDSNDYDNESFNGEKNILLKKYFTSQEYKNSIVSCLDWSNNVNFYPFLYNSKLLTSR
jgi:uncharacterized glyoxalase superfamily protein PhnB